jgi:hypothetical protein
MSGVGVALNVGALVALTGSLLILIRFPSRGASQDVKNANASGSAPDISAVLENDEVAR